MTATRSAPLWYLQHLANSMDCPTPFVNDEGNLCIPSPFGKRWQATGTHELSSPSYDAEARAALYAAMLAGLEDCPDTCRACFDDE